jgi:uncharacterized protein (TIGR02145 family)
MQPINRAPAAPSNPDPVNGATGVSLVPNLSWVCSDVNGDDMSYDIYLGLTSNPLLVQAAHADSSYTPAQLLPDTTYYWKVVAIDEGGLSTAGPLWTFSTIPPPFQCGDDFTDFRDGKVYHTILIGSQCWMKENLDAGTMILNSVLPANNGTIEKYCYQNDVNNCTVYGGLYKWDEMMNYSVTEGTQGICPADWHVATDGEWTAASNLWGGESIAGGKMKESGTTHWNAPNTDATNESGMTTLPGGYLTTDNGTFSNLHTNGNWWVSTQWDVAQAWDRGMYHDNATIVRNYNQKSYSFSVRCVKN